MRRCGPRHIIRQLFDRWALLFKMGDCLDAFDAAKARAEKAAGHASQRRRAGGAAPPPGRRRCHSAIWLHAGILPAAMRTYIAFSPPAPDIRLRTAERALRHAMRHYFQKRPHWHYRFVIAATAQRAGRATPDFDAAAPAIGAHLAMPPSQAHDAGRASALADTTRCEHRRRRRKILLRQRAEFLFVAAVAFHVSRRLPYLVISCRCRRR